jgi:hypothetical protein
LAGEGPGGGGGDEGQWEQKDQQERFAEESFDGGVAQAGAQGRQRSSCLRVSGDFLPGPRLSKVMTLACHPHYQTIRVRIFWRKPALFALRFGGSRYGRATPTSTRSLTNRINRKANERNGPFYFVIWRFYSSYGRE